ncbi:MAG: hypothetical protein DRP71_07890 [Verrucomicrobia bacterium]|nr:MAG: hypothetical protein DRP71_07890 [Verrucomicrobiota bacterium]
MSKKFSYPVGGLHPDSAVLCQALEAIGVKSPHTGKPLTESLVFGLAGGVGAGYSFCPTVKARKGNGVAIAGRHLAQVTNTSWFEGALKRLGLKYEVTRATTPGLALKNLKAGLEKGGPIIVLCGRDTLPWYHEAADGGDLFMYSLLVHEIGKDEAVVTDWAGMVHELPLKVLARARNQIGSQKNATIRIEPMEHTDLGPAVIESVAVCVNGLDTPKTKTYSFEGWSQWAKFMTARKSKKGWPVAFPGGNLFGPLRDVFCSIETVGTGGGLFRLLYSRFMHEASFITGLRGFSSVASSYRGLGEGWGALAEFCLPDRVEVFRETKNLLRKRRKAYEREGPSEEYQDCTVRLNELNKSVTAEFPLNEEESLELLRGLEAEVERLIVDEGRALRELAAAAEIGLEVG